MGKRKFIVHVDMDAFFAAIEQRDNADMQGKPVVVGSDPKGGKGRGVVSTCSYEARKFGIHSAMPISIAYRKCPHAAFLPVDMEKYSAVSMQIHKIFYDFTPDIEPVSIDEAFLDITGSYHLFGTPLETCMSIKSRVKKETGLTASVGLAPTKMAAKIASDLKKPDGMVEVTPEGLLEFLRPLDIRKLWGLGEKSERTFRDIGINTIGDIAGIDPERAQALFGKNGIYFWQLANGIDDREIETAREARSISNEFTFEKDTDDQEKIKSALLTLCEKVSDRLRSEILKGRTITLKIRLQGFLTYTRAYTMADSTNHVDDIFMNIKDLYDDFDREMKKVRLIGVKVSNLSPANFKDSLFAENGSEKSEKIHKAVDVIKDKYGSGSIYRAGQSHIL
jgi:nucleotidyltransferase/DNA polymerase involved in DNA repair